MGTELACIGQEDNWKSLSQTGCLCCGINSIVSYSPCGHDLPITMEHGRSPGPSLAIGSCRTLIVFARAGHRWAKLLTPSPLWQSRQGMAGQAPAQPQLWAVCPVLAGGSLPPRCCAKTGSSYMYREVKSLASTLKALNLFSFPVSFSFCQQCCFHNINAFWKNLAFQTLKRVFLFALFYLILKAVLLDLFCRLEKKRSKNLSISLNHTLHKVEVLFKATELFLFVFKLSHHF